MLPLGQALENGGASALQWDWVADNSTWTISVAASGTGNERENP